MLYLNKFYSSFQ